METESDSAIPFLDVLVIRKGLTLATKAEKPSHTGRYLNFKSNHPLPVKKGLTLSLHNRAFAISQEQDLFNEISSLKCDLQLKDS
jgi:hypothetical protein